jgi:hypothetical protein
MIVSVFPMQENPVIRERSLQCNVPHWRAQPAELYQACTGMLAPELRTFCEVTKGDFLDISHSLEDSGEA